MKTKNQFRKYKYEQIAKIWDMYPDLTPSERMFMVIDELDHKAVVSGDHEQLGSCNEYGRASDPLFINPKTGQPRLEAINWVHKLMSAIRRDKAHPHIRPYTQAYIEVLADGTEAVRNYVTLLRGKAAVIRVNNRLQKQIQGLKETQRLNADLINVKRVTKEAENYRQELEYKQAEANKRKGKRRY